MGLQSSLALDSCNFEAVFPGITRSVATLVASFKIPFFREWILMNGESLQFMKNEPSNCVVKPRLMKQYL